MATAGQGDVLSGVLGALVARGRDTYEAAVLGAWLCGYAAESALIDCGARCETEETLTALTVLEHLPCAYRHVGIVL